jgi:hypothetical protein
MSNLAKHCTPTTNARQHAFDPLAAPGAFIDNLDSRLVGRGFPAISKPSGQYWRFGIRRWGECKRIEFQWVGAWNRAR